MNSKGNTITIKIFWPAMTRSYGIALSNRSGSFCLILIPERYESINSKPTTKKS